MTVGPRGEPTIALKVTSHNHWAVSALVTHEIGHLLGAHHHEDGHTTALLMEAASWMPSDIGTPIGGAMSIVTRSQRCWPPFEMSGARLLPGVAVPPGSSSLREQTQASTMMLPNIPASKCPSISQTIW